MTTPRHARCPLLLAVIATLAVALLATAGCRREAPPPAAGGAKTEARAKALVAAIRAEPKTFNRYTARDSILEMFSQLTTARLVRIDRRTQALEPWLAESWTGSPDGLTWTLKLRQGVAFSDGVPFTSADVLFAFQAVYDERTDSPIGESMKVGGKPLQVSAPDAGTVVVRFPSPFGPGIRLLDNLPILPRHKLQAALAAGTFAKAWGVSTPPAEIVGLGPFVLTAYQPGQRLVFDRNPRYFRKAPDGTPYPALDRLTIEIVPDQNAEVLGLQTGQIDITHGEVPPENYAALKQAADQGKVTITDLGVGLDADSLWLNLRPDRKAAASRPWLLRAELRRAIAHAVDRQAFADTVFLGAALPIYGPITPANTRWYNPNIPKSEHDPAESKRLLASIGLTDRNGDGMLEDRSGAPASFTIITQKGNAACERGAAFISEELKKVGLAVPVAAMDSGAAIDRLERGDYDALYYRLLATDPDPALNIDLWESSGSAHVWNPGQAQPATPWEREIDQLMRKQVSTLDQAERKALFDRVQVIFAEELPIIQFAAPRIYVVTSTRVANATPTVLRPVVLWNPDQIGIK